MISNVDDMYFMGLALEQAKKALALGEVPIGAVVVSGGKVVAAAHNMTEALTDVTAHAEMLAITAAQSALGKFLNDATMYVTVEPCTMCAGAIGWARLGRLVYGAGEPRVGFSSIVKKSPLHPKTLVQFGVRADEAVDLMQSFFKNKRKI